ncbi:MAG: peptidylprolyl isomerase [Kangiellaceae bacterium]|jgi:peptidyl-prolyl cis-trans isomerase B (cyclophilin B)|nr:peptidylprolyl isomerase [Kangiellaceae bacterium]|tara:strand:+ start:6599 stop:7099 length:501 start_codon:yes stop_codon:yes gene_type:complete
MSLVRFKTNFGDICIELFSAEAPKTVANFLNYCESGFYDGTIFHRVIDNFVIQGGGHTEDMERKTPGDPIDNEANNGLSNTRGTLCMARTPHPHSATSQFFINVADNKNLDFVSESMEGWGYCVFGKVVEGMDVVDQIKSVPTSYKNGMQDVPVENIVIDKVEMVD